MRVMILAAILLVAACGSSPPTQFYRLAVISPGSRTEQPIPAPVTLAMVHIPPSLDRAELVRQTGQTQVSIQSQDRWAGSLSDMIRDVLSQDLASRLPSGAVIPPDAPAAADMRGIVVTIVEFGPDGQKQIRFAGDWSILPEGAKTPALRRDFALTLPWSGAGGADQAEAMSRALAQLADAIAAALSEKGGS